MKQKQWFTCDRPSELLGFTLSISDWSFSASSSVSSWILGPSSFFFFLSSSASLAALSAFSFFSFSCFVCFSLWAFSAILLWLAKASLISWKKEVARNEGYVQVCLGYCVLQWSQMSQKWQIQWHCSPSLEHLNRHRWRNPFCGGGSWKMC